MTSTLVAAVVGDHELAAPDSLVGTVARAVKRKPDHRLITGMPALGHHRCQMGMVMLHHDQRAVAGVRPCPRRTAVARMLVSDDHLGLDAGYLLEMITRNIESL